MRSTAPDSKPSRFARLHQLALALFCAAMVVVSLPAAAQTGNLSLGATRIDIPLHGTGNIKLAGVTKVIVLRDNICEVTSRGDSLEIVANERGETMVFAWVGDQRKVFMVHVGELQVEAPAPTLRMHGESPATGVVSTTVQGVTTSGGDAVVFASDRFDWRESHADSSLFVTGQFQQSTAISTPGFNVNTASIAYRSGNLRVSLLDSIFPVTGKRFEAAVPLFSVGNYTYRGADIGFQRGNSQYDVFAGYTLPAYYLDNRGTRQVAGVTASSKMGNAEFFATTAGVSAPVMQTLAGASQQRNVSAYQLFGTNWQVSKNFVAQFTGGLSTRGAMAQAAARYATATTTLSAGFSSSSAEFPLNQLQLATASPFAVDAAATHRFTDRLYGSTYFEHHGAGFDLFGNPLGASNYSNSGIDFLVNNHNRLNLYYSRGKFSYVGSEVTNNKVEATYSAEFTRNIGNVVAVSTNGSDDPAHSAFDRDYSIRDDMNIRFPGHGTLQLGFFQQHSNPALVTRIFQELDLLPAGLRDQFLLSPNQFVGSGLLTPELRQLFADAQPSSTQFSVGGQFDIKSRLNVSPTYTFITNQQIRGLGENSHTFGYTMSWQLSQRFSLQSAMSNVLLYDSHNDAFRRTMLVSIGLNHSFSSMPIGSVLKRERTGIHGRVFRDINFNGRATENSGLAGIPVHLDDGRVTHTDKNGVFTFDGLRHRVYRVSVVASELDHPVRFSTSPDQEVDLTNTYVGTAQIGVVDFARVYGTVFNDYLLNARRQPDAPPLTNVALSIASNDGAIHRKLQSDSAGEFELDDLPAGRYHVDLAKSTLPAGFVATKDTWQFEVGPVSSVSLELPVRALRSISGRIGYRDAVENGNGPQAPLVPLEGVKLAIGDQVVTTDANGEFLFRDLPAGPVTIRLVPLVQPPSDVKLPSWPIKLPEAPFNAEGIKISLRNANLLIYLQPKIAQVLIPAMRNRGAVPKP